MSASGSTSPDNEDTTPSEIGLLKKVWLSNQGVILILCAEACASAMDAIARYLQQGENGLHTFQIIFARMSVTFVLSSMYLWWKQIPDFPLGNPSVRLLLILRALFGFGGLFCLYYSVHYLPLAEATIFRFLTPLLTSFACSLFLHQPFTRKDLLVSIIALFGIVIIAHPTSIVGVMFLPVGLNELIYSHTEDLLTKSDVITPVQRSIAIIVATLGIIGSSGSYTTIRIIGNRAHALQSVNYYAFLCTLGSALFLVLFPGVSFTSLSSHQWIPLFLLGFLGFALQFLLTKGLQLDSSSKATSMMYSQVIYAILFDWFIWGVLPNRWDIIGGVIVLGSTLWSVLSKPNIHQQKELDSREIVDEENPLLGNTINRENTAK
ncbi:putative membrane protein [Golovinomyces cichoracearum]|uniref:Putative membrane protein n=1 Tax=Golovinomyces cichoracearum TaxID=62708 RepID=A0A420ITG8_9PEZI|nr:putative membrane protein [Golovinomyces cichoracearum]